VSVGVTVKGSLVMISTTFIQLYLPARAVATIFLSYVPARRQCSLCANEPEEFFAVDFAASNWLASIGFH